ncbi:tRNA pseudouridine(55) synthase TruB [Mycoplasma sp. 3341]|uniref:tRNA pseudouridine(55) synthase TruB n=1 Tax=Mycoplasma sp. 3341 TaxID=3447506 RepID=UPI003F66057F
MFFKINKAKGVSSFKAIRDFAKQNNIQKIGHCGTLDPLATGLLIVATDQDTKLLNYILSQDKRYICTMQLFRHSASWDSDSIVSILEWKEISHNQLERAFEQIKNSEEQIPPVFSAKKINGVRAYELARKNIDVSLKPNKIKIHELKILNYDLENDEVTFEAFVSKGTYIRSIVHDVALLLNTDAIMVDLKRTQVGNVLLDEQRKVSEIDNIEQLFGINIVTLNKDELKTLFKERVVRKKYNLPNANYLLKHNNNFLGIVQIFDDQLKVIKIFWPLLEAIIREE